MVIEQDGGSIKMRTVDTRLHQALKLDWTQQGSDRFFGT